MASTHQKHPAPKVAFSKFPLDLTLDEAEGSTPRTGRPSSSCDMTLIPARTTKINRPPARYVLGSRSCCTLLILPPSQNVQISLSERSSLPRLSFLLEALRSKELSPSSSSVLKQSFTAEWRLVAFYSWRAPEP